jgi:hypothetical protein
MRSLRRDLFERRLWPLVIVILAAIAAVPFLLHGGHAGAAIAPPPATSGASTPAVTGTRHAAQGAHRARTPTSGTRDPFQEAGVRAPTADHLIQSTTSTTTTVSRAPTPTSTSNSSASSGASPSAAGPSTATSLPTAPAPPTPAPTTPVVSTPPVVTAPTQTDPPTGSRRVSSNRSWDVYSVDLRIGAPGSPVAHRDIARLTPLPGERSPQVMYMGVADHGRRAVFALGAGVEVRSISADRSAGAFCDPSRVDCALLVIPAGKSVGLSYVSSTGAVRTLVLRLSRISSQMTRSSAVMNTARRRVSAVGLCDLKLGDPIGFFNPADDNVKIPSTAACRHQKLAVPFPGSLGAGSSERG